MEGAQNSTHEARSLNSWHQQRKQGDSLGCTRMPFSTFSMVSPTCNLNSEGGGKRTGSMASLATCGVQGYPGIYEILFEKTKTETARWLTWQPEFDAPKPHQGGRRVDFTKVSRGSHMYLVSLSLLCLCLSLQYIRVYNFKD